jgi:hypothetical protein
MRFFNLSAPPVRRNHREFRRILGEKEHNAGLLACCCHLTGRDLCYFFCMKTALYGRIVFGASAVLFGVIALMWHDSGTWQTLSQIWSLPFGSFVGGCLMIAQIACGIGMQYPRTARLASVVVGVVYSLFSLACVPGIIAAPTIYAQYGSFFEQFSLLCGAIAPVRCN